MGGCGRRRGGGWERGEGVVLGGGGGRGVVKSSASSSVNLPSPQSMRGAVHTGSAGPLKSTEQSCRREDSQKGWGNRGPS